MTRPRLLILSFSPIHRDARVLKQVRMALATYEVTTCGFGPAPEGVDRHIEITHSTLPWKTWDLLLEAKAYSAGYWAMPDVRRARKALRGLDFDLVLADDIDTLPLALALRPRCGVHSDLHEYFPRLAEEHPPWRKRIGPWYEWLCRRYLPRANSVTTVSRSIANEYAARFGVEVAVVTNATPFREMSPTPVHSPIRVVHSGTSHRERNIGAIVEGVLAVPGFTLDLYLTPNDPGYLRELKERAETEPRLTVHDPVPYSELIETLNDYDIGVHLLPPINFNFANALPNKIFDFVQARIAAIVGPSPEMARIVDEAHVGVVAHGFTGEDLAEALRALTPEAITEFKAAADAHAETFSAQSEVPKWEAALAAIVDGGSAREGRPQ